MLRSVGLKIRELRCGMFKKRRITVNSFPKPFTYTIGKDEPPVKAGDLVRHPDIRGLVEVLKVEEVE